MAEWIPDPTPYEGDVGTIFLLRVLDRDGVPVDLSATTLRQMKFRMPDGTLVTKTAVFNDGTGANGELQYIGEDGFLPAGSHGEWSRWVYLEWASKKFTSTPHTFVVLEAGDAP